MPEALKYWSISLKFTKDISARNFNIDKAKVGSQKEPTTDSFCLGPRPYNRKLKAKYALRLEFNCHKAKLYEAASNAFFVFHPNSTNSIKTSIYQSLASGSTGERSRKAHSAVATEQLGFDLQVINSVRGGWKIAVKFSKPVAEISNINKARFEGRSQDRRTFYIKNVSGQIQNANLKQCILVLRATRLNL